MFHLDNFQQIVLSLLGKRTKNIGFGKYISGLENICKCRQTFIDNLCLQLHIIYSTQDTFHDVYIVSSYGFIDALQSKE